MIHAFEPLRTITDGEYPGADTYWNALASRSHWLYGQAHALNFPFAQRWGTGIVVPIWEGETPVRSEHMTLKFSARVNLTGPSGVARLQYYSSVGGWTDLVTDTTTGVLRFFGGATEITVDLTGLTPADGIWTLRLMLTGDGGWGIVYRAYLTGTTGFTAWPGTLPTFTTGSPTTAANLDKLRQMQQYLFDCASQPRIAVRLGTVTQQQEASYQTVYRWAFQYTGTKRLYYYLTVTGLSGGGHVYLYLIPDTYNANAGDSRIATLMDAAADNVYSGNIDLSTYGLTVGAGYGLELVAYYGATVEVGNIVLADLGGVTRTYIPKDHWVHGDTPTKAILDVYTNDLNQMYPASDRQSPIFSQHTFSTWQGPATLGLLEYTAFRFRGVRRWRYLRYRGAGRLVSADGTVTVSLSDTDPAGGPQVLDLESVAVPYGMEYYVESYGSGVIVTAYEDYA